MATTMLDGYRETRLRLYNQALQANVLTKVLVATGFAGFLALLSQLSIPVPWTPVPLTMQVVGVYLIGTYLGPRYALVSLGIYLAAGAFGLHVFAPSTNSYNPDALWAADRWKILVPNLAKHTGYTAGYIFGWVLASAFVGYYMRQRSARLDSRFLWAGVIALVALLGILALAALFVSDGNTLGDWSTDTGGQYDADSDTVLLFVGAASVAIPLVLWMLWRSRGGSEAVNLFVVFLAATAIIHVCGLLVLKPVLDVPWRQAAALASAVFLPFDAVKAGLAVLLSLPFLPSRNELEANPA